MPTNESVCVVTLEVYQAIHGKEPADGMNTFGWRELDGLVENFPTDDSEKVSYGDSVSVYDEVHVNPCYSWCVDKYTLDKQTTYNYISGTQKRTDRCRPCDKVFFVFQEQFNGNSFIKFAALPTCIHM